MARDPRKRSGGTWQRELESKRVVFSPSQMLPLSHMALADPLAIGVFFRLIPYLVTSPSGLDESTLAKIANRRPAAFRKLWPDLRPLLNEVTPDRWTIGEQPWFKVQTVRGNVQQFFDALAAYWGAQCVYCGNADCDLEVDHIVPFSRGGSDDLTNLTLACSRCNNQKRAKTAAEFGFPHVHERAKGIQ